MTRKWLRLMFPMVALMLIRTLDPGCYAQQPSEPISPARPAASPSRDNRAMDPTDAENARDRDADASTTGSNDPETVAGDGTDFSSTTSTYAQADSPDYDNKLGLALLKNLAEDQKSIWTSLARIRLEDAAWLVPYGGLTAGFIATDRDTSFHLSNNPQTLTHYDNLSNYGIAGLAGGTGALYFWGQITHDEHKSETGLLSGEAAIDALAVVTALKYATGRERPLDGDHAGHFGTGGDSFPSDHAAVAWSIAGVLTHEYPGPLTKF